MSGLATKPLQRLCKLIVDCPHSTPKWTDKGFVVLRNQNIRFGRLDLSNPSYTDEEHYNYRIKRGVPSFGDIVLTREAPMGEVCAIPKDLKCCLGQRMVLIRPDPKKLDFTYLLYALQGKSIQHQIGWSKGTGTTVSNLRIPILKALEIPDLPLKEQREVAHKLKTLDDKIALNRRTNATLEAMAQSLFKSWFVDFDPVIDNALDAGHALPVALATRVAQRKAVRANGDYAPLAAEVRALFPASFAWSEALGKFVPEGWGVKPISSLCKKIQNGSTPKRSEDSFWENGDIPWLTSGEVRTDLITKTSQFITEAGLKNSSAKLNPPGATVVAMYGATAGEVALLGITTTTNQAVCALLPLPNARLFNYLCLSTKVRELAGKARGSAQQNISKGIIESFEVVVPTENILIKFEELCSTFFETRFSNSYESATLSTLRDVLLGELIG